MKPIEAVTPRVVQRPWGTETFLVETPDYLGKLLYYEAGKAGGLQMHVEKDEAFHLVSGEAWVDSDDGTGTLIRQKMTPGMTFHIPNGAPHRFEAVVDCFVFEVSTPHYEDRVRLEEHYGVDVIGDGPGLPTTREVE